MPRQVKRYENRKLYDLEDNAYVSLQDIARHVRAGETVQVTDNVTGEDITAQTLTQVILEEGRRGQSLLPSDVLHDLLRQGSTAVDVGVTQLRQGIASVLQRPMDQLSKVFSSPRGDEVERLRAQVLHLEKVLDEVLEERSERDVESSTKDETAS